MSNAVEGGPDVWRPLAGLRVLELQASAIGAGAGKLFREYGAEVVLLEDPAAPLAIRQEGPFTPGECDANAGGLHRYLNAGKLGVSLRDDQPDGRRLTQRLAAAADLVVHELPDRVAGERGLTYAQLREHAPALVVLSLTPFGGDGPYADWTADENTLFAMSGRMYMQGQPERAPLPFAPGIIASQIAATAAGAAMSALFAAAASGTGSGVAVSGLEAQLASVDNLFLFWTMAGRETPRGFYPPYTYPCADGNVLLGAVGPKYLAGMAAALALPELVSDPRFSSPPVLAEHQVEFDAIVIPFFLSKTRAEIVARLQAHGVMCAPLEPPQQTPFNEQYRARGFFQPLDQTAPDSLLPGPSFRLDAATPPPAPQRAPWPGQHTAEVLSRWLGVADDELTTLARLGVFL